jgi:hypothetical protein
MPAPLRRYLVDPVARKPLNCAGGLRCRFLGEYHPGRMPRILKHPSRRVTTANMGGRAMLTMWGTSSPRTCDGASRRDFLKVGSLTAAGLGLPDLLQARKRPH